MHQPIADRLSAAASALSLDPREAARLARQVGLRGLVIDLATAQLNLSDLSTSGRREFRQILASQNQQLVALQLDLGGRGLAPGADVDRQIARLDRAMEAAAELQTAMVCVDLGPLPLPPPSPKPRPIPPAEAGLIIIPQPQTEQPPPEPAAFPDPAFVSQLSSALAEIGARADRYSVILAFSSALAGFASLQHALAAVKCPWFGVDLDPIAILRDEWDRDAIFSAIGPLIRHVRARDGALGAQKRVKPALIGNGDVGWESLLALLDEAAYQGFFTLDPLEMADRLHAIQSGAAHLRAISG